MEPDQVMHVSVRSLPSGADKLSTALRAFEGPMNSLGLDLLRAFPRSSISSTPKDMITAESSIAVYPMAWAFGGATLKEWASGCDWYWAADRRATVR